MAFLIGLLIASAIGIAVAEDAHESGMTRWCGFAVFVFLFVFLFLPICLLVRSTRSYPSSDEDRMHQADELDSRSTAELACFRHAHLIAKTRARARLTWRSNENRIGKLH